MKCIYSNSTDSSNDESESSNANSNLIATIAATEAAIRIASDIIDSTLAYADEHIENRNNATQIERSLITTNGMCELQFSTILQHIHLMFFFFNF